MSTEPLRLTVYTIQFLGHLFQSGAYTCIYPVHACQFLMTLLSVPYTQRISSRLFSHSFPDDCHNFHPACPQTWPPRYLVFLQSAILLPSPFLFCLCLPFIQIFAKGSYMYTRFYTCGAHQIYTLPSCSAKTSPQTPPVFCHLGGLDCPHWRIQKK